MTTGINNKERNAMKQQHIRIPLKPKDIVLLLDCLETCMPEELAKKNRRKWNSVYDLYQTVGQALGEKDIFLEFKEQTNV